MSENALESSGKTTASRYRGLKPWKRGESGNPSGLPGRPRRRDFTKALEKLAPRKLPAAILKAAKAAGFTGKTWAEFVTFGQAMDAAKGNTAAYNALADRLEGKVPQPIASFDGEPLPDDLESIRTRGILILEEVRSRRKA